MIIEDIRSDLPEAGPASVCPPTSAQGFTLVEVLIAIVILTFGLLAAGQLLCVAMGSASLARSKGSAAVAAQNKLETLADLYRQDPNGVDLSIGSHGPQQVQVLNPANSRILNRYEIAWQVATVPDPRAGKILKAKQVTVTVTPINSAGAQNLRAGLNKVVSVSSIFSVRAE